MNVDEAILQRRTHKFFGGGPIADTCLRELLELAIWAPNHGLTEPWRFSVVSGGRLGALQECLDAAFGAMDKGGDGAELLALKRRKMGRRIAGAGAVIAVSYRHTPDRPVTDREDYAAAACAVQNILLGATARGLVGLWSTGKVMGHPKVRAFLQQGDDEGQVGVLFLGTPAQAAVPRRSQTIAALSRWI